MPAKLLRRLAAAGLFALLGHDLLAAPRAELLERWTVHDAAAATTVDHAAWSELLSRHVRRDSDGINRFAYGEVGATERRLLQEYLARLSATPVSRLARPEQFAFWINLYNALTIDLVLRHYPVASILDIRISPGLFSAGPWGAKLIDIEGVPVGLDDVEHRILRPIWRDPRVHYVLNCASLGCPNLVAEAFTADRLDAMLDRAAADFVNHPRAARIDAGRLRVSSIFVWYRADFGGTDQAVIDHLRRHAAAPLADRLRAIGTIAGHDYDWRLNDAAP